MRRGRANFIGLGVPVHARVVDDGGGDRLRGNPLEDAGDRPLLGEPCGVRVIRLDLVAQIPVGEQAQLRREEPLAAGVDQMVHPDVVFRDVLGRLRRSLADGEIDLRGDALGKPLGQPRFRPLTARPAVPLGDAFGQARQGEVQENGERKLVGEKVVHDVGRRVVAGQRLVEGEDRAQIEVRLTPEVPVDLEHVTVQRLHRELESGEERFPNRLLAREVLARERFERGGVAVLRAPELGGLLQAARESRPDGLAVASRQLLFETGDRLIHRVLPSSGARRGDAEERDRGQERPESSCEGG